MYMYSTWQFRLLKHKYMYKYLWTVYIHMWAEKAQCFHINVHKRSSGPHSSGIPVARGSTPELHAQYIRH